MCDVTDVTLSASTTSLSTRPAAAAAAAADDEGRVLVAGNHGFQFDYTLPRDLPSSYDARWGSVKYSVKATLSRPGRFDIERDTELTVSAHVDLNDDADLAVSSSSSVPCGLVYCHARLCVCLSVCPRPYAHTTARTRM